MREFEVLNDVLGRKYKVTTGYRSGNEINVAMERGEVSGWTAAWENLTGTKPHWLRDKQVTLLVQFAVERIPDLPNVPTLLELTPPDKKDIVEFITSGPVVMMCIQGDGAIGACRTMMGATNPQDAAPGTIRGDYALDLGQNVIHGSDSTESAARELGIHFADSEITA